MIKTSYFFLSACSLLFVIAILACAEDPPLFEQKIPAKISVVTSHSALEQRIYAALESPATFDFKNTSVKDLMEWVSDEYDIPYLIDEVEFFNEGISPNDVVSLHGGPIRLGLGLKALLDQLELAIVVHEDVLKVTTYFAREDEEHFEIWVYDIRPLKLKQQKEMLPKHLVTLMGDTTWRAMEGFGEVTLVKDALIVRQLPHVHKEIEDALNQLLEVRRQRHTQKTSSKAEKTVTKQTH